MPEPLRGTADTQAPCSEAPQDKPLFLQTRNNVPLAADFKPALKVLARKPPPKMLSRGDATSSMAGLSLEDDDSEEEAKKRQAETFAERQARAQREREEKQRKYQEARERILGSSTPTSEEAQGRSSTPNRHSRGKGRGRSDRDSQPTSSADQSPARGSRKKELYDPSYTAKPNSVYIQKRDTAENRSRSATPAEDQPIRAPRGPDGTGRGGFGFAPRGGRSGGAA